MDDCARGIVLLKLTTDRYEACFARSLCDSRSIYLLSQAVFKVESQR